MAKRPIAEANKISQLLNTVSPGGSRFPVDVGQVAIEWSHGCSPKDPIVKIEAFDIEGIEGILARNPNVEKWKIGYNSRAKSPGRTRFTLAHEFGHYVCIRPVNAP